MNIKSLFNNLRATQFYQLFRFGVLLLISIALAKSSLTTEEIGQFEKFLYLSGIVSFFWIHGLTRAILSFNNINKYESGLRNPLFFHVFLISILLSVLTIIIILIFESFFSHIFLSTKQIPYLNYFIIYFLFSTPAFVIDYLYILLNKPIQLVLYGIITFSIHFLVVVIPVYLGFSIEYSFIGLVFISIIRFVWSTTIILKQSQLKWDNLFAKTLIKHSLPLILGSLIAGSLPYIDGMYVSHYYDNTTFAIYMYGARELPLTILLANSLNNVIIPEFTSIERIPIVIEKLRVQTLKLIHILFPLSIILMLFSKDLYLLFYNEKFLDSALIFNVLLFLIISRLVFPQSILAALKYNKELLTASVLEFFVKIIATFFLIKYYGIFGIAVATVVAYTFEKIWLIAVVWKKLKISPKKYIPLGWIFIYSIILTFVFLQTEFHIIK